MPKNLAKYEGDYTKITWRSTWEMRAFAWCDENPNVAKWSSEEQVVPYLCKTDNKYHRYFVDLKITFKTGKTILVEIKPEHQVRKPKVEGKKMTKQLLESITTYAKNVSKWEAAEKYCAERGWQFMIWDQNYLATLGIKIGGNVKKGLR